MFVEDDVSRTGGGVGVLLGQRVSHTRRTRAMTITVVSVHDPKRLLTDRNRPWCLPPEIREWQLTANMVAETFEFKTMLDVPKAKLVKYPAKT